MLAPVVTWDDRILSTLEKQSEIDALGRIDGQDTDEPYWTVHDIEELHKEIAQRTLLKIANEARDLGPAQHTEIEQLGEAVVIESTISVLGTALPQNALMILSAQIQPQVGANFFPATGPLDAEEWQEIGALTAENELAFAVIGGNVYFKGNAVRLLYMVEPDLATLRSDVLTLPAAAYLEECDNFVHQMLVASDWLPIGQM